MRNKKLKKGKSSYTGNNTYILCDTYYCTDIHNDCYISERPK